MNEQERFEAGDQVVVSNLQSPFYGWTGEVKELFHNENGWPRYRVACNFDERAPLSLLFDDAELELK